MSCRARIAVRSRMITENQLLETVSRFLLQSESELHIRVNSIPVFSSGFLNCKPLFPPLPPGNIVKRSTRTKYHQKSKKRSLLDF